MADFTIKLNDEDGGVPASDVNLIGNSLKAMAGELAALVANNASIHRTGDGFQDYETQRNAGNWTADAVTAANDLLNSLSVKIWNGENVVGEINHNDSNSIDQVLANTRLIFVFEEPGDMVIPVPAASQIARGETNAPLKFPSDYDQLVSKPTLDTLKAELGAKLQAAQAGSNGLEDVQITAVMAALQEVGDELAQIAQNDKADIFMSQLGDYSVRQCAS